MDFEKCLYTRHSVRKFKNDEVPEEMLNRILEAGIYAPSACNFEAWKFIVLRDSERKDMLENKILSAAPVAVLVVYRNDLYVSGREHMDYVQSAAAAIQNMLLCAHDLGLGGCWICHYPSAERVRTMFNIPSNFDPIGCFALGYPAAGDESTKAQMEYHYGSVEAFKEHKRRFSLKQVVCYDLFQVEVGDCTMTQYPNKYNQQKNTIKRKLKSILMPFKNRGGAVNNWFYSKIGGGRIVYACA